MRPVIFVCLGLPVPPGAGPHPGRRAVRRRAGPAHLGPRLRPSVQPASARRADQRSRSGDAQSLQQRPSPLAPRSSRCRIMRVPLAASIGSAPRLRRLLARRLTRSIVAGCAISRAERTVPCPKRLRKFLALHSGRMVRCTCVVSSGTPESAAAQESRKCAFLD
jgi:hypothetical protein